jgi:ADP-ribose pyrophosphatase YjhB (NUDIX family)
MFQLGAFALIFDSDGAILLCHRRDLDAWNLPGGRVEQGESPWDAVVRETREEVGLQVEVDRLAGAYFKPDQAEVVFSFVCRMVTGELTTSEEADDVRFFPLDALPANTISRHVERIHDALTSPNAPVLREQTGPGTRQLVAQGRWPFS